MQQLINISPAWVIHGLYLALLAGLCGYGVHRYYLVWHFRRSRGKQSRPTRPAARFDQLPIVTVQLPLFNEPAVVQRVIDAACRMQYPQDRFEVQVLDDSTDETTELARQRVAYWQEQGIDVHLIHRTNRQGYKAGALAEGLAKARGDYIAIFDADFTPPSSFLKRTIHHFTDPSVGMVQTRWTHLNRSHSLLTQGQAVMLDGHFLIEHGARHEMGAWMNFNGTAGIWRRQAIEASGGWQHDTLTEDMDLSYRAQLNGWRFVFLPSVRCPAELPPEMIAFKTQQHRWTKGSIQTAMKLLPAVIRSDAPWKVKREAIIHMTAPLGYLLMTGLALTFYPALLFGVETLGDGTWWGIVIGTLLLTFGAVSALVFYVTSQRTQRVGLVTSIVRTPIVMALGVGMAINSSIACLEAIFGFKSGFVRTPKYADRTIRKTLQGFLPSFKWLVIALELAMGVYMIECVRLSVLGGSTLLSTPFLLLFAFGYLYVGLSSLMAMFGLWPVAAPTGTTDTPDASLSVAAVGDHA